MEVSKNPRISGNTKLKQEIVGEDLFNFPKSKLEKRFLAAGQIGDRFDVLIRMDAQRSVSIKYLENSRTKEIFVLEVNRIGMTSEAAKVKSDHVLFSGNI